MTDNLVIDKLMDIQRCMGTVEGHISELQGDIKSVRADVIKMENRLSDSFVIPISNRIIIVVVGLALSALGVNEYII